MIKQLWRKFGINPLDRLLKKAVKRKQTKFLLCWNRGLGDIALGMYALVYRIRHFIPDAKITFVTRSDLSQGFRLLENVTLLIDPAMKRKQAFDLDACLQSHDLKRSDFDVVIEHPDPTYWLKWQLGTLVPRLRWVSEWEELHRKFAIDPAKRCIGVHVHSETSYGYEKNWPHTHWQEFFNEITRKGDVQVLLFGHAPTPLFPVEGVIDLRGKTTLAEMLSLLKNTCQSLVVPDSGVLSLIYFLDAEFPLKIVSLWADPHQGVLKQNVASPNPLLVHVPLRAPQEDLRKLTVADVLQEVGTC
jgi:ADP-heptose:LPS heptosyltransferase